MIDITNYDNNNIFAKILRQEIPSRKVFENKYVYAFEDINPQAPIHILQKKLTQSLFVNL